MLPIGVNSLSLTNQKKLEEAVFGPVSSWLIAIVPIALNGKATGAL